MRGAFVAILLLGFATSFSPPPAPPNARLAVSSLSAKSAARVSFVPACLSASLSFLLSTCPPPALAVDVEGKGASAVENAKITTGGASTLQSGRTIAITRGVNLDRSDFSNQDLKGVAFQQSIVRDANFKNSNLFGASFFDATIDGSDFENCDLSQVNLEMAQLNRANLKNAVVKDAYVSGSTLFEGVSSIENSDWSDTFLRADQKKYLCGHPTAKGVNPKTGAETRESLMCLD
mmetsp:Transcript_31772/g.63024  ORF Transcript_31772/g.63024 Transcript_31772/m.63024 type:complete len:234 (+) Transcript_31772:198-899(+)